MQVIRDLVHGVLEVPTMVQLLGVRSNRNILVLGCGNGIALEALVKLRNPRSMTGIDLDQARLDQAQDRLCARGISAYLVQGDVRAMPFIHHSFDLVVDFGVCYRVPQPAEALNEVSRVLRFGGMFAMSLLLHSYWPIHCVLQGVCLGMESRRWFRPEEQSFGPPEPSGLAT